MSYTVIDSQGRQNVYLEKPEVIPSDSLWDGLSVELPAQYRILSVERNPDGLLSWLYSNSEYQSLMNTHGGIVAAFERQIAENRYPLALQLWNQLPVPQALIDLLFAGDGPLVTNGYQDLIDFANQ